MTRASILKFQWIADYFEFVLELSMCIFVVVFYLKHSLFIKNLVLDEEYVLMILIKVLLLKNTSLLYRASRNHRSILNYYRLYRLIFFQNRDLLVFGGTSPIIIHEPMGFQNVARILSAKFQVAKLHRLRS